MLSIFTRNSTNRKQLLNLSPNLCTNKPKHDIMHSAKLKTMCSADKDFAMQIYQKGLCGKFWTIAFHPDAMAKAPEA